ncbi:hypothetical protein H5410_058349 [Solanum commersonii]|uniref:Uncharacterized protein n=1 Tax=Solanum commersonii TaxID=4109 RepID=A0A9J5WSH8_SOLCO|nr:hypothetical protein H5410_058349 [Solanum commersonii]
MVQFNSGVPRDIDIYYNKVSFPRTGCLTDGGKRHSSSRLICHIHFAKPDYQIWSSPDQLQKRSRCTRSPRAPEIKTRFKTKLTCMETKIKMLQKMSCQMEVTASTNPSFTNRHVKKFSTKYISMLNSSRRPTRK